MKTTFAKYSLPKDLVFPEYYNNGMVKRCILGEKCTFHLPCGDFIPQYKDNGKRKELKKSMTFYDSGNIASMVLQSVMPVKTRIGTIPAEMITFYESGAVKRIFPSFGTITAFWTQKDEYGISPELTIALPVGTFNGKAINISFYETGEFKSITLWPKNIFPIKTPVGVIKTHIGFCLYPDGKVKSVEPAAAVDVYTKIGTISCFDPDALGLDGENNSLVFSEDGSVKSLITSAAKVTLDCGKKIFTYAPSSATSHYFDELTTVPMKICFSHGQVSFGGRINSSDRDKFEISECTFKIDEFVTQNPNNICDECCG